VGGESRVSVEFSANGRGACEGNGLGSGTGTNASCGGVTEHLLGSADFADAARIYVDNSDRVFLDLDFAAVVVAKHPELPFSRPG